MQFTTVALTFVAAVAAINPNAKEAFVANYIANAKRQAAASNGTVAAASASASGNSTGGSGVGAASTSTAVVKSTGLPTSTSDATVMALSGSALLAGVMALVL